MSEDNSTYYEHHNEHDHKDFNSCIKCVCEVLSDILEEEKENKKAYKTACDLRQIKQSAYNDIIPFILQTPFGHPFFTWGKIGSDNCFVTVFFRVIKVDCKNNCAVLQLLKPNKSIIDQDTDCVETTSICDVDFVTPTKECVVVDLKCYSAVKCISPSFVKKH